MGKTHKNQKTAKGPAPQLRSRNTRSSKGRLLSDTSSSTTQLNSQLSLLGLYAAHTVGDGNCLFRALSDQLYGSPSKHQELRQQICDHIELHKARYEPFVEDDRGLDDHLRAMRENATYGGHMELSAFANMTKRSVKVIQPGLVYVIECEGGGSGTSGPRDANSSSMTTAAETDEVCSDSSPRRSRRMSVKSPGGPDSSKNKVMTDDDKEEVKVKLGKGYFVYEEVTSDEEDAQDSRAVEAMVNVGGTAQNSDMHSGKPTVYVAYHDWEHFSSIRNLRGPHTGLPNVSEAPPPDAHFQAGPEPGLSSKDREKERKKEWQRKEKERKERERERREKERREKERASATGLKVKLKVPPSLASSNPSANASTTSLVPSGSTTPATLPPSSYAASDSQSSQASVQDPSQIPLPSSRSSSPFIRNVGSSPSLAMFSSSVPSQPSSLASEIHPEAQSPPVTSNGSTSSLLSSSPNPREHPRHPHAHVIPQTPRSHYRSPKRTYDESSGSGGEDAGTDEDRRRRRRVGSVGYSGSSWDGEKAKAKETDVLVNLGGEGDMEVDVHIDVEYVGDTDSTFGGLTGGAETPALSAPGSSTGSSSSSSPSSSASVSEVSISRSASVAPGADMLDDNDEWDDDDDEGDVTVVMDGASLSNSISSEHTVVEGIDTHAQTGEFVIPEVLGDKIKEKYMHTGGTGGDKPLTRRQRKALGLPKPRKGHPVPTTGMSAGRIVIPGGKWRGRSSPNPGAAATQVQQDGVTEEEWRRNGTGRLDVRGFRELKI